MRRCREREGPVAHVSYCLRGGYLNHLKVAPGRLRSQGGPKPRPRLQPLVGRHRPGRSRRFTPQNESEKTGADADSDICDVEQVEARVADSYIDEVDDT